MTLVTLVLLASPVLRVREWRATQVRPVRLDPSVSEKPAQQGQPEPGQQVPPDLSERLALLDLGIQVPPASRVTPEARVQLVLLGQARPDPLVQRVRQVQPEARVLPAPLAPRVLETPDR